MYYLWYNNNPTRTVTKSWQKQKYQSSTSGISFCPVTLKLNSGYIFLSRLSNHFLTIHSEMTLPVIVISNGARIVVTKIIKTSILVENLMIRCHLRLT